eukprot:3144760-Rhodomonas_salina.1
MGAGTAVADEGQEDPRLHTIRYVSTAHDCTPYAVSVVHTSAHHTLCQYCTRLHTIRCVSTAHDCTPYAMRVPDMG